MRSRATTRIRRGLRRPVGVEGLEDRRLLSGGGKAAGVAVLLERGAAAVEVAQATHVSRVTAARVCRVPGKTVRLPVGASAADAGSGSNLGVDSGGSETGAVSISSDGSLGDPVESAAMATVSTGLTTQAAGEPTSPAPALRA